MPRLILLMVGCLSLIQALLLSALAAQADDFASVAKPGRVSFNRDVRPILSDKCFRCHGPDSAARQGELRLDLRDAALAEHEGRRAIVPGDPQASELVRRIVTEDESERMPPVDSELSLSAAERETLRRWVAEGAEYERHWAFTPPVRPALPQDADLGEVKHPIDRFVRARLKREGLQPAPEADPATLCRRLYLDITGIPPTPAEVEEFVAAYSLKQGKTTRKPGDKEQIYAALVDKLLASPRYGERMAAPWLDAARYADTNGYQTDGPRRMWRWRDWVIDAFNANLPYDRFTVEQLAGDLLPHPTLEQQIATGFNRNHRMNAEGGIIAEEYLVEYVVDRVETTTTVWLGLTLGCARCHDHKYDPFSQQDFYRLFAFFNNVPEPGKAVRDDNSPPFILAPTKEQQVRHAELQAAVASAAKRRPEVLQQVEQAEKAWLGEAARDPSRWTIDEGLLMRLRFDEALADDVNPKATAKFTGKRSAAAFGPGPFARSLELDGAGSVETDQVPSFDSEAPFTGTAWLRPAAGGTMTVLAAADADMSYNGLELKLVEGRPQLVLAARVLDDVIRVETLAPLPVNQWSHVAWTYDGSRSAKGVEFYIDGRPAKSRIVTNTLSNKFKTTTPLVIGDGGTADKWRGRLAELRFYSRELDPEEVAIAYCDLSVRSLAQEYGKWRDPASAVKLREYFLRFVATKELREAAAEEHNMRQALRAFEATLPTTMVMREQPGLRETHVLKRGEYDKPGEKVTAGVPEAFGLPLPTDEKADRLALARWLVDRRHPLTARVAVNRIWQQLFGVGLVKTVEDFGSQGEWPIHQELLDWLAVEFQTEGRGESGRGKEQTTTSASGSRSSSFPLPPSSVPSGHAWDIKRLIKLIVTSDTYRQSSHVSPAAAARDPENRLLARGARFRLSAEAIRDSALAAAGLLHERLGGPSVKPYQPAGLWEELASGTIRYDQDHGADLYRRSLYTFRKRTVVQPFMATFDAAGREACVVRQTRTNTPLQALNLLNDVTYVEAARVLGARMLKEGGDSPTDRIAYGFRLTLGRGPTKSEAAIVLKGFERRLAEFRANVKAAAALLRQGESPVDKKLDPAESAAYATVGNVLLNLDEFVTRE